MFLKLFPTLLWDDEPAAASPAEPAAEQTPAAPEPGPAPWASDLATYIEDEGARAQADRYLREKWQPRTTQLEQELAQLKPVQELVNDLNEDPLGTYAALTAEIFGDELAKKVDNLVRAGLSPEQAVEAVVEEQQEENPTRDPEVEEMLAERRAKKQRELFDAELERIKTKPEAAGLLLDREAIAPFVLQSNGDFDAALVGYKAYVDTLRQHYAPEGETPPPPPPPNVLGTQQGDAPPATPPTTKTYKWSEMDEALDSYFAETRNQGPSTLGVV